MRDGIGKDLIDSLSERQGTHTCKEDKEIESNSTGEERTIRIKTYTDNVWGGNIG